MTTPLATAPPAERVAIDRPVLISGGLALAGCAVLALMPPGEGALYPPCPFLLATGLDCPFCGGLRSTHALIQGDVSRAFDHNVLVPVLLVAGVVGFTWWAIQRLRQGPVTVNWSRAVNRWVIPVAMIGIAVFWLVRNLPAFPYLDSGVG